MWKRNTKTLAIKLDTWYQCDKNHMLMGRNSKIYIKTSLYVNLNGIIML